MNACFERFVRSMLVRGISRRARGDTSFFANRRTHAVVALDEFVINGTRRKKLAAFSLFSFTPPWPRRRLVVSWGSPPFGRTTKVPLIACTYLNSCLRLVRSELSLRVCVSCLCICVCVCVYVMRFFCFHSRTCSRTSEFRAAKYHLLSFYKYIIFLSSRDFILTVIYAKNTIKIVVDWQELNVLYQPISFSLDGTRILRGVLKVPFRWLMIF